MTATPYSHLTPTPDTLYGLPRASRPALAHRNKAHLSQTFFAQYVSLHGVSSNVAVEVFNGMSLVARMQPTLYRSMLAMMQLLESRRQSVSRVMLQVCIGTVGHSTHVIVTPVLAHRPGRCLE